MNLKLSEIANIKLGYSFRASVAEEKAGDIYIITAKNINDNGQIDLDFSLKLEDRGFKADHFLENEDVIINTRLNFKAGIYLSSSKMKAIAASPLIVIRVKDRKTILPEYLNIYLNSDKMQRELMSFSDTGIIPFINLSQIKDINIVSPEIEKQKQIIKFDKLSKVEKQINNKIILLKRKMYKKILSELIFN